MIYKDPCVYAVGNEYQIVINTLEFGKCWVEVGGKAYNDSVGGLVRTETLVHRVRVPMKALDAAKEYRVCFRALAERKPYFPELGELKYRDYAFRPVDTSRRVNVYMLADTHSQVAAPAKAAEYFGDGLDLLIMNGDIPTACQTHEDIRSIFDITSAVTHGGIPVVFARGNHDYRGQYALDLPQYIGNDNGNTYFTFRLGGIWGIVLDCGEDKTDDHPEYGGLTDCHDMRLKETEFIESVVANAENEYLAEGVNVRLVVTHLPFCAECISAGSPIFNIEVPLFTRWTELLNEIKPHVMLSGHMHFVQTALPGTRDVRMGAQFPVLIASEPYFNGKTCTRAEHAGAEYIGMAMTIEGERISCLATADNGTVTEIYRG